ncbi:MAG: hypothetical protein OHK0038_09320 [Flammeovirgaceae bacterium]
MKSHTKKFNSLVAMLLFFALALSCSREDEFQPTAFKNINEFLEQNDIKEQSFKINPNQTNTINTESGTKLNIPSGTLVDASGNPITSEIEIKLLEAIDREDVILSGMPTTSNGELLVSGGEFDIDLGEDVKVGENGQLTMEVPISDTTVMAGMQLYVEGVDSFGNFTWIPVAGGISTTNNSYIVTLPSGFSGGGINIDKPIRMPLTPYVSVKPDTSLLPVIQPNQDTLIKTYITLKNFNSVDYPKFDEIRQSFVSYAIPANQEAMAIMMYYQENKLFYGKQSFVGDSTKGTSLIVRLKEINPLSLKDSLENLWVK